MINPKLPRRRAILGAGAVIGTAAAGVLFALPANAAPPPAPTVTFANGVLSITGTAADDGLTVGATTTGSSTLGTITLNGKEVLGGTVPVRNVSVIKIAGGAGNNVMKFDESGGITLPRGEFVGGAGRDTMTGGSGADSFVGGAGIDRVIGGPGADTVSLGDGTDQFTWNPGDGADHVDGDADADALLVNGSAADDVFDTKANGGRASFRLIAPPFDNVDFGGFEQLKIDTGTGNDDVFVAALPVTAATQVRLNLGQPNIQSDSVTVALGNDSEKVRALGSREAGITVSGMPVPVLMGGAEKLTVVGGFGDDLIDGSRLPAGALDGFEMFGYSNDGPPSHGHDTLIGSAGDDQIFGFDDGGDRIEGRGGNDTIFGTPDHDTILGGDGDDFINGLGGNDDVDGGPGNNVIIQ